MGVKKILVIFSIACLCIVILGANTIFSSNSRQERTLTKVIDQIFTWPNSKLNNELVNLEGGLLIGENVPSQENVSSNIEKILSQMYQKYFTDNYFNKFCGERIPLQYLLFAKQHNYKVSVKK